MKLVFPIEKYPTLEVEENTEDLGGQMNTRRITLALFRAARGMINFLGRLFCSGMHHYGRVVDCATVSLRFLAELARQYSSISSSVRPFVSGTI